MKKARFDVGLIGQLDDRDAGIEKAFVRVNNRRIDAKGIDPARLRRRQAVTLLNRDNRLKTVVFALGSPSLPFDGIAIDWDSRQAIGLGYSDRSGNIELRPSRAHEVMRHYLFHHDAGLRLSVRLGLLGAALGVLSLVDTLVLVAGQLI